MNEGLGHTRTFLQQGISEGWHHGAQLYISRGGSVIADLVLGESRPDVPMTPDTINLWLSCVKPVAAVAIAQLWERGLLCLDDRVVKFIPEFGVRGKETITIRHVLTHTGGFRAVVGLDGNASYEDAVARVIEAPLEPRWVPGRTAGYHGVSGWYVLAELIRRIDSRPFERYVRDEIFLPLGMKDCWAGMPKEVFHSYARRIGCLYDTSGGDGASKQPAFCNSDEDAAAVRPGGNGRGPMRELGRFYEMLLNHGRRQDSPRILLPQTVEAITSPHRVGLYDQTFKHVMDWGLGFIINSNQYGPETVPYGYGPHASPRTFGHSGSQSSCAFCDPEHDLVVAWLCNGQPGEPRHQSRQRILNRTIYEDLKLA